MFYIDLSDFKNFYVKFKSYEMQSSSFINMLYVAGFNNLGVAI